VYRAGGFPAKGVSVQVSGKAIPTPETIIIDLAHDMSCGFPALAGLF
jgi:hypothetical protein